MTPMGDGMSPTYTIKKLQQWDGMDGYGCSGEVHGPAGIVAHFRDDGPSA